MFERERGIGAYLVCIAAKGASLKTLLGAAATVNVEARLAFHLSCFHGDMLRGSGTKSRGPGQHGSRE